MKYDGVWGVEERCPLWNYPTREDALSVVRAYLGNIKAVQEKYRLVELNWRGATDLTGKKVK